MLLITDATLKRRIMIDVLTSGSMSVCIKLKAIKICRIVNQCDGHS